MMWEPAYQTTLLDTIVKYPRLIYIAVDCGTYPYMDEYRIRLPGYALEVTRGIRRSGL